MVDIQSKEVIDKISDELKVQPSLQIPRELMKQIQLVYNVNPTRIVNVLESASGSVSGNTVAFTTPATQDFFLTGVTISTISDATADNTSILGFCTLEGKASANFITIVKLTTTAHEQTSVIEFNPPLKLERNTTVGVFTSFTVGANTKAINIIGFVTDPQ